jgi:hypothetical protein
MRSSSTTQTSLRLCARTWPVPAALDKRLRALEALAAGRDSAAQARAVAEASARLIAAVNSLDDPRTCGTPSRG